MIYSFEDFVVQKIVDALTVKENIIRKVADSIIIVEGWRTLKDYFWELRRKRGSAKEETNNKARDKTTIENLAIGWVERGNNW